MYPSAFPPTVKGRRGVVELFYITPKYHGNVIPSKIVPKTYFNERNGRGLLKNEVASLLFFLSS
jgi:hypothetical protein